MSKQNKNDTCVYRFYDSDNICLYVGITEDFKTRMKQHENDKEWFIKVNRFEHSEYMNRNQAKIYEIYYISKLKPMHNNDHISFVDGFNMNMEELYFKEYTKQKHRHDIRNKLMIEICREYFGIDRDSHKLILKYDDLNKIYNRVEQCENAEVICKYFSQVLNKLHDLGICSICGCGYNSYTPTWVYDIEIPQDTFSNKGSYEMFESTVSKISIDLKNINILQLDLVMCNKDTSKNILNKLFRETNYRIDVNDSGTESENKDIFNKMFGY